MTKQEIWRRLQAPEPQERAGRAYFEEHGRDYPIWNALLEQLRTQGYSIGLNMPEAEAAGLLRQLGSLGEHMVFAEGKNVDINKEHRYVDMFAHAHQYFEVECLLRGCCYHVVEGHEFPMRRGDVMIVPPGAMHNLRTEHDSIALNIKIRKSTFHRVFTSVLEKGTPLAAYFWKSLESGAEQPPVAFHCGSDPLAEELLVHLYGQQLEQKPYCEPIIESLTQAFLCYLMQSADPDILAAGGSRMDEIKKYIALHWRGLTLEELAKAQHLSPAYLSRYIRAQSGKTFTRLIEEARMAEARRLLEESDLKVDRVCQLADYAEVSYFIRRFKQAFGVTPKQYQQQCRRADKGGA